MIFINLKFTFTAMRDEILKKLTEGGLLNQFKQHPLWVEAFEEYKKATGDTQVGMRCGSCYRKVLKWLKQ